MPDNTPATKTYIYTGNVSPGNSSVAFDYEGERYNVGDEIALTNEQFAFLSQYFFLHTPDEVAAQQAEVPEQTPDAPESKEPDTADTPAPGGDPDLDTPATSGQAGSLKDETKNASRSSKS